VLGPWEGRLRVSIKLKEARVEKRKIIEKVPWLALLSPPSKMSASTGTATYLRDLFELTIDAERIEQCQ
jgi:hypothetical protein